MENLRLIQRTNMETLNIYLKKEERRKIDQLKQKYRLSLTTIIDVLCKYTMQCLKLNTDKQIEQDFTTRQLYMLEGKTSIKLPRWLKKNEVTNKSAYANNVIHCFINHDIGKYIKNADIITGKYGYYNLIEQELQKRVDNWWQYNNFVRTQRRMLRENKEYFKKAIEQL